MTIKRLFDCLDHQLQHFPRPDMLAARENSQWIPYSTQQVADTVNRLSAGLMKLGVSGNDMTPEGSDKIAIISNNRPEWVFTDLAAQQLGAILVPVYPTTNPLELEFILNDAAVKFIFVSNEATTDQVTEAYEYRVQGFFKKPMSIEDQAEMFDIILKYWIICRHPNKKDN